MIIRQLADAIRAQNWFTVVTEVLIVVFGVVIGIEVSNWNDARRFDAQERELLVRLREEVASNNRRLQHRIVFTGQVIDAGRNGIEFLKRNEPCSDDCATLLIDFFHASQVWGASPSTKVYSEMQRLGLPRSADMKDAIDEYYNVFSGLAVTLNALPEFRKQVRGRIPENHIESLWRYCHRVDSGAVEVLEQDCGSKIQEVGPGAIDYIRNSPGLYDNLNGWIGQNIFATQELPRQVALGEAVVKTIDAALKSRK